MHQGFMFLIVVRDPHGLTVCMPTIYKSVAVYGLLVPLATV